MPNTIWAHHIGFDNLVTNRCRILGEQLLTIVTSRIATSFTNDMFCEMHVKQQGCNDNLNNSKNFIFLYGLTKEKYEQLSWHKYGNSKTKGETPLRTNLAEKFS